MSRNLALQWKYRFEDEKLTELLLQQEQQRNAQMQKEILRMHKKMDKLSESVGSMALSQSVVGQQPYGMVTEVADAVATPRPVSRINCQFAESQTDAEPAAKVTESSMLQPAEHSDASVAAEVDRVYAEMHLSGAQNAWEKVREILQEEERIQRACERELERLSGAGSGEVVEAPGVGWKDARGSEREALPKSLQFALKKLRSAVEERDAKIEQQRVDLNRVVDEGMSLVEKYQKAEKAWKEARDELQRVRDESRELYESQAIRELQAANELQEVKESKALQTLQKTSQAAIRELEEKCKESQQTIKRQESELRLLQKHHSQAQALTLEALAEEKQAFEAQEVLDDEMRQRVLKRLGRGQGDGKNEATDQELVAEALEQAERQEEESRAAIAEKDKTIKELKLQNMGLKKKVEVSTAATQQLQQILNQIGANLSLDSESARLSSKQVGEKLLQMTAQCQELRRSNFQLQERLSTNDEATLQRLLSITQPQKPADLSSSRLEDAMKAELADTKVELQRALLQVSQLNAQLLEAFEQRAKVDAELAKTKQKLVYTDRMAQQEKELHDVLVQESEMLRQALDVVAKSIDQAGERRTKTEQLINQQKMAKKGASPAAAHDDVAFLKAELECAQLEKIALEEDCKEQLLLITKLGEQFQDQQQRITSIMRQ